MQPKISSRFALVSGSTKTFISTKIVPKWKKFFASLEKAFRGPQAPPLPPREPVAERARYLREAERYLAGAILIVQMKGYEFK